MNSKRGVTFREYKNKYNINKIHNLPNSLGKEGEDHINISMCSEFTGCRALDIRYNYRFQYPHIGHFNSVAGLMYWLRSETKPDELRLLNSFRLSWFIRKNNLKLKAIPNYTAILTYATWLKVKDDEYLVNSIKELPDLEIVSYNVRKDTGLRIVSSHVNQIVISIPEIIKAIKEDREPDTLSLCKDTSKIGKSYLEGIIEFLNE